MRQKDQPMNSKPLFLIALLGGCITFGCNKEKPVPLDKCSTHTKCSAGYKCNFHGANPSDPKAVGECEYQTCGLTVPCKTPRQCLPDKETATCDQMDVDKFCGCVSPNSSDMPHTPTTG